MTEEQITPDPEPVNTDQRDISVFGEYPKEFVECYGSTETDPYGLCMGFMASVSIALKRSVSIPYGGDLFPHLFVLGLADTGAGKDLIPKSSASLLKRIAVAATVMRDVSSAEAFVEQLRDNRHVAMIYKEMGALMGRMRSHQTRLMKTKLMEAYDATSPIDLRRTKRKDRQAVIVADNYSVGVIGVSNRPALHVHEEDIHDGTINRFWITNLREMPIIANPPTPNEAGLEALGNTLCAILAGFQGSTHSFVPTADGLTAWTEHYTAFKGSLRGLPPAERDAVARGHVLARKLALLMAVLEGRSIDADVMERAWRIERVAREDAIAFVSGMAQWEDGDELQKVRKRILDLFRETEALDRAELQTGVGGRHKKPVFDKALSGLLKDDLLAIRLHGARTSYIRLFTSSPGASGPQIPRTAPETTTSGNGHADTPSTGIRRL